MSAWTTAAAVDVKSQLFRALAVLRVIVLLNTVVLTVYRVDNFTVPGGRARVRRGDGRVDGLRPLGVRRAASAWARPPGRRPGRRGGACSPSRPLVKGTEFNASVPGYWTMGVLFAWAIQYRTAGGLAAGVVLTAVDLAVRPDLTQTNYGNAFLLVLGGLVVGYMCESLQRMAIEREVAERTAAAAAERTRLARVVHDGVLQVLALVQRRGTSWGRTAASWPGSRASRSASCAP